MALGGDSLTDVRVQGQGQDEVRFVWVVSLPVIQPG